MRKVVLYELLSLDGVAEQPEAFITDFDEIMGKNFARVISSQDAGNWLSACRLPGNELMSASSV